MKKRGPFDLSVRPWGLLAAAGYAACAATAIGFLGRFWWFADLFSHFRIQYLGALAVAGLLMSLAKRAVAAVTFSVFAAVNLACIAAAYWAPNVAGPASPSLRVMLANVNSELGDPERVLAAVADIDPDVVALEETDARWMDALSPLRKKYPHVLSAPREDNFGIALFSKRPLESARVAEIGAAGVPTLFASVPLGDSRIELVATHPLPPFGASYSALRNDQLEQLARAIDASKPTVLVGDLNTTPWNHYLRRFLERSGLRDTARFPQVTWPTFFAPLRIPLDHVLASPQVAVTRRTFGPNVGSDHFPVVADVVLRER